MLLFAATGLPEGSIADWPKDFHPLPLGRTEEVRKTISSAWPGTDWSDLAWGWFESAELATEINFQLEGEVESLMLHVRGGADPIPIVRRLCDALGAVAIDSSTGNLLESNTGSSGYPRWVEYRNQVVGQKAPPGASA